MGKRDSAVSTRMRFRGRFSPGDWSEGLSEPTGFPYRKRVVTAAARFTVVVVVLSSIICRFCIGKSACPQTIEKADTYENFPQFWVSPNYAPGLPKLRSGSPQTTLRVSPNYAPGLPKLRSVSPNYAPGLPKLRSVILTPFNVWHVTVAVSPNYARSPQTTLRVSPNNALVRSGTAVICLLDFGPPILNELASGFLKEQR